MTTLAELQIDPAQFDMAIMVSASGEVDTRSGGASALLVDEHNSVKLASGATMVNVRFMDVMAIVAALQYHRSKLADDGRVYRCLILSENFDLVEDASSDKRQDAFEWSTLGWFEQNGYELHWQWESARAVRKRQTARAAVHMRTTVRRAVAWPNC